MLRGVTGALHIGDTEALEWDRFLESHPLGQFQQSAKWARVKAVEGWQAHRLGLAAEPDHLWGAQILWKKTRLGRFGYISKGPVLVEENPTVVRTALGEICHAARRLGLRALIVQPPDDSSITTADLVGCGFLPAPVPGVISATALVNLEGDRAGIEARMSRRAKQQAKQARNCGLRIRFGKRSDLRIFFELMLSSCQRQGVLPNPSRVEVLEAIWDNFQPHVHLVFARIGEEDVAGWFIIGFGERCTFWKKGWNRCPRAVHANHLLTAEALYWAADAGYRLADFGGLDRSVAESLLAGAPLTPEQQRSKDVFHLRMGGVPKVLPVAQIFSADRMLNCVLRSLCRFPRLWGWSFKLVARG